MTAAERKKIVAGAGPEGALVLWRSWFHAPGECGRGVPNGLQRSKRSGSYVYYATMSDAKGDLGWVMFSPFQRNPDGGRSGTLASVAFCPWCGEKLP